MGRGCFSESNKCNSWRKSWAREPPPIGRRIWYIQFFLISYGDRYMKTLIKINLACQDTHGKGIQLVFGHYIYMMTSRAPWLCRRTCAVCMS